MTKTSYTYDPRLLHDDVWRRTAQPALDLPKGTIWAHRVDHSRGWPEHDAEYVLDLRIRYPETKPLLDQLAAEQRQVDSELRAEQAAALDDIRTHRHNPKRRQNQAQHTGC